MSGFTTVGDVIESLRAKFEEKRIFGLEIDRFPGEVGFVRLKGDFGSSVAAISEAVHEAIGGFEMVHDFEGRPLCRVVMG